MQRLIGGGESFQVGFGIISEAHEGGDLLGEPVAKAMFSGSISMLFLFDSLLALPGAAVAGDGLVFEVDGEGLLIGLDDDLPADRPGRDAVGVAVEADGKIRVNPGEGGLAAVGEMLWQRPHGIRPEPVDGALAGCRMDSFVRHLVSPLGGLGLEIGEVLEGSQGPEVVPDVVNGALLDLSLLMGFADIAGSGNDPQGAKEIEEGLIEPDDGPLALDDRGQHVVVDELFWTPLKKPEGVQEALVEAFLPLGEGELEGEHPAVAFHNREAGEFPCGLSLIHI